MSARFAAAFIRPVAAAAASALLPSASVSLRSSTSALRSCVAGPSSPLRQSARRSFSSSPVTLHGLQRPEPGTGLKITFKEASGKVIKTVEANEGDDILSIAHEHDIDLEGACERSCACSTCHVILDPDVYDTLPEPTDEENDMLDLAFGLTDTSRLGCQVLLTKEVDGLVATIPSATRNMFVDGSKPTKH